VKIFFFVIQNITIQQKIVTKMIRMATLNGFSTDSKMNTTDTRQIPIQIPKDILKSVISSFMGSMLA